MDIVQSPVVLSVSQFLTDIRVSTMNPTPSVTAPSSSRFVKQVSSLYVRTANTNLHQKFVSICLHDHLTPKGLQLKIQPCAPKCPCRKLASRLQNNWTQIMERTCTDFLTSLKLYHRVMCIPSQMPGRWSRGIHWSSLWENENKVDQKRSQNHSHQPKFPSPGTAL